MNREIYRFQIRQQSVFSDVQESLYVAIFAAEGLHGRAQVQLEAGIWIDETKRSCVIDAATVVGQSIARIFTGLLQRLFGEDSFEVDRLTESPVIDTVDVATTH